MGTKAELLPGTLDLLVLKATSLGPQHGYGVSVWISERTGGELELEDAALYQALHRLESRGPVELWEFSNEIYFRLGADGGEVMHEEHKAIQLQPGAYRVWKQRQYEPQGARAIED